MPAGPGGEPRRRRAAPDSRDERRGVLAVRTSVFHRKRAERFAQLLDEAGGARRHHVRSRADHELADFVEVSQRLSRIDFGARADPEFQEGLRAMLMATIERAGIGATAVDPPEPAARRRPVAESKMSWLPARSRRARSAVVVSLAVGTLAVSGMSAASGNAMPGDPLYGMKRSTEQAQLALASSQVSRGQLYLEFAKTRMDEAAAVRGDAPDLAGVLDDMDNETRQGVRLLTTSAIDGRDTAPLDVVDAFAATQRQTLTGMLGAVTGGARNRTVGSLQTLDSINKRTEALRGTLRCADFTGMTRDDLGPTPGRCVAQGPPQPSTAGGATAGGSTPASDGGPGVTGGAGVGGATSSPGGVAVPNPLSTNQTGSPTAPSTPEDTRHSDESLVDRIGQLLGAAHQLG
jgi:hypothetical protein